MPRSFEPKRTNVLSVLENHLSVPKYQRPYTWKIDNIEMLWEDMWSQEGLNFLGIIVLHDNNTRDETGTVRIEIIDGQQRLTTITIMLALIRNLAQSIFNEDLAIETQMAIEKSNAMGSRGYTLEGGSNLLGFLKSKIQNRESEHEYLESVTLSSLTDEQEKVVRNYRKARDMIVDDERWLQSDDEARALFLKEVKKKLLESEMIQVTVTSEDDAYDLFETLNSRSVSLSEVNMIKNRLFMSLSGIFEDKVLEEKWSIIEQNAGGDKKKAEEIQKFINYFWWSRYSKIPPKQIFRTLRNENLEFILSEFESDSAVYKKIRAQDSSQLIQYRHIDLTEICVLAQLLNLHQVYIPLLSLARKMSLPEDKYWSDFSNNKVEPFIRKLEKFIFAYKFSPRSPAAVERMYSKNAVSLFAAKNRTDFVNALLAFESELNENFPTEDEFKQSFRKHKYIPGASTNNRIISYALSKAYFGDNREIMITEADIEHIFPRNPAGKFKADEKDIEQEVNSLGNLTPLSEEINRKQCQNKRPNEKMHFYRDSNILRNHKIADFINANGWSATDIENRTGDLVDEVWNYLTN